MDLSIKPVFVAKKSNVPLGHRLLHTNRVYINDNDSDIFKIEMKDKQSLTFSQMFYKRVSPIHSLSSKTSDSVHLSANPEESDQASYSGFEYVSSSGNFDILKFNSLDKYINLYPTCQVTRGKVKSTILDAERQDLYNVPSTLIDVLEYGKNLTYRELLDVYVDSMDTLNSYIDFLLQYELAFFTEVKVKNLPFLNPKVDWCNPSIISNAILEIAREESYSILEIIGQLSDLLCENVELRYVEMTDSVLVDQHLEAFSKTNIHCVDIIFEIVPESLSEIVKVVKKCGRVRNVYIYNISSLKLEQVKSDLMASKDFDDLHNFESIISECTSTSANCGCINKNSFNIDVQAHREAIEYNSCLNRKISVDRMGMIKNCPSLEKAYGSCQELTLLQVAETAEFKKYGLLSKDKIDVCMSCEFRHVCHDCRAFTQDDNLYSKPKKCSYDPSTGKWER